MFILHQTHTDKMMKCSLTVCILLTVFVNGLGAPIPVENTMGATLSFGSRFSVDHPFLECHTQGTGTEGVCEEFKSRDIQISSSCTRSLLTTTPEDFKCNIALEKDGMFVAHNSKGNVWFITLNEEIFSILFETTIQNTPGMEYPVFRYVATLSHLDCMD